MAIKAPAPEAKNRELIPQGMHVARCYSMIHVGTTTWEYKGEKKSTNKVRLTWEFPNEVRVFDEAKGEQPMVLSMEFTLSMYEKAKLRQTLENWRGKKFTDKEADGFDITKLLGQPCMINVTHQEAKNGNIYARIGSVNPLPKGMKCPAQINDTFEFNFDDKFDRAWLADAPEFLKEMIMNTPEFEAREMDLEQREKLNQVANEGFNRPVAPAQSVDEIPVDEEETPF